MWACVPAQGLIHLGIIAVRAEKLRDVGLVKLQGGPKKQPPSDIAITQPKINIFISHFQSLKRRYFYTRPPNFIKK